MSGIENPWLFYSLLPVVAFLYAAIGHGGASGYLALMAIFNADVSIMKPCALVLNLFVAALSFYHYYRNGHFRWHLFYPFAISSVPAAYFGGSLQLDIGIYKIILVIILLGSALRLQVSPKSADFRKGNFPLFAAVVSGALIGFFSGLIGIGGGVILSPVILLLHWANMKETAAVSALFIWINSLSGLGGFLVSDGTVPLQVTGLIAAVLIGGWAGGYFGSARFNTLALRRILSVVLVLASFKLLLT